MATTAQLTKLVADLTARVVKLEKDLAAARKVIAKIAAAQTTFG
jgi:hypothetical protein